MSDYPKYLKLRDTGFHDDQGGSGQRIFTTAGQGYKTVQYVRANEIERLREESKECQCCGYSGNDLPKYRKLLREAAGVEWISVSERLPEESGCYLCYSVEGRMRGGSIEVILFNKQAEGFLSNWDAETTHWMNLPKPPKDTQEVEGESKQPT